MSRPSIIVCAGAELFRSFFPLAARRRLTRLFRWQRDDSQQLTPRLVRKLKRAEAVITTWDSPHFGEDLPRLAPHLGVIAHCGGEVKSRFARPLFDRLTITASPIPMARATAEFGATLLLYCARNVDFYREELRKRSNRIYSELHLHGCAESIVGREVAMIGFGRIGRALVDLMRGFDLKWLVHDPYAPRSLERKYPIRFVSLEALLPEAKLLVLTAALTEETRGILSKARLARLPDGAVVVNIARGGLIDLNALMAASNHKVRQAMADVVIDDLENFFKGKGVKNRVTTSMLDRMT